MWYDSHLEQKLGDAVAWLVREALLRKEGDRGGVAGAPVAHVPPVQQYHSVKHLVDVERWRVDRHQQRASYRAWTKTAWGLGFMVQGLGFRV